MIKIISNDKLEMVLGYGMVSVKMVGEESTRDYLVSDLHKTLVSALKQYGITRADLCFMIADSVTRIKNNIKEFSSGLVILTEEMLIVDDYLWINQEYCKISAREDEEDVEDGGEGRYIEYRESHLKTLAIMIYTNYKDSLYEVLVSVLESLRYYTINVNSVLNVNSITCQQEIISVKDYVIKNSTVYKIEEIHIDTTDMNTRNILVKYENISRLFLEYDNDILKQRRLVTQENIDNYELVAQLMKV